MKSFEEGKIAIRKASPLDFAQIVEVENISFKNPYPPALILSFLHLHDDSSFVATANDKIIGYVIGARKSKARGHIISIAVRPEWRRKGIGSKLMNTLLDLFKQEGLKFVELEVAVSNEEAIAFYESLGFRKVGVVKGYYSWGEDAYIMVKKLQSNMH